MWNSVNYQVGGRKPGVEADTYTEEIFVSISKGQT